MDALADTHAPPARRHATRRVAAMRRRCSAAKSLGRRRERPRGCEKMICAMAVHVAGSRARPEAPLYLTSALLTEAGLPHLFSTRHFPGVRAWRDPRGPFDRS